MLLGKAGEATSCLTHCDVGVLAEVDFATAGS